MDVITLIVLSISAIWIIWSVGSYFSTVNKSIEAFNNLIVHSFKQISELHEAIHKVENDVSELKGDKK